MSQWLKQGMQLVSQHPAAPPVLSRRSHPTMAAHVAALHCTWQVCCRSTSHISELHPQSRTKPLPQPLAADAKPPSTVPSLWAQPHRSRIQLFYVNLCLSFMKRAGSKEQFYITPADCSIRPHINTQSDGMLLLLWNTLSLHCSMRRLCD